MNVETLVQTKLPDVLAQIVITYIGSKCDNCSFIIFFKEHIVEMSVKNISLLWGHYYNGVPYRDVSLNGVVSKYWHNNNRIPISRLTRAVSNHTLTTVTVTQKIDKHDTGGHH